MPKTYTAVPSVSTGDVYTAATYNTYTAQNVNNLIVPPSCIVRRTTNQTSYTSNTAITWESTLYDTDSPMWASSPNATRVTIQTAGIYLVSFIGYVTASATMTAIQPRVYLNGVANIAMDATLNAVNSGTGGTWMLSGTMSLSASDYLEAGVGFTGGSAYVINGSATSQAFSQTRLAVTWIGRTS